MKNVLAILVLMLSASITFGQFGIKAGVVTSSFKTSDEAFTNDKSRTGFTAGVLYNHCLGCDFGLQGELNYVQKGESYTLSGYDVDADLAYLDMPISVTYQPIGPLYLYLGPLFSFNLLNNTSYQKDGEAVVFENQKKSSFRFFDFGYNTGLGLKFNNIILDARFTSGFLKADNKQSSEDHTIPQAKLKNRTVQLTLGYLFGK